MIQLEITPTEAALIEQMKEDAIAWRVHIDSMQRGLWGAGDKQELRRSVGYGRRH